MCQRNIIIINTRYKYSMKQAKKLKTQNTLLHNMRDKNAHIQYWN